MNTDDMCRAFTDHAAGTLTQDLAQIERCAALLDRDALWERPNSHTNSVGNLVRHLAGNVGQWILDGLGNVPFERDRPAEFAARASRPGVDELAELSQTVTRAIEIIRGLDAAALGRRIRPQGYDVTGLVAVFHVVEHFSFHTGQIVHQTKILRDIDLSLYDAQGHKRDQSGVP